MVKTEKQINQLVNLGTAIETLRKDRKITQEKFHKRKGMDGSSLRRLCRGERDVGVLKIYKAAEILDVSAAEIFMEADKDFQDGVIRRILRNISNGNLAFKHIKPCLSARELDKKKLMLFLSEFMVYLQKC